MRRKRKRDRIPERQTKDSLHLFQQLIYLKLCWWRGGKREGRGEGGGGGGGKNLEGSIS